MTTRLAVFDCDGTLVDGQAHVCNAMEAAFAAANLPSPARSDVRRIVGLSLLQAVRMLAPNASTQESELLVQSYKDAFRAARENGEVHEPLFEGIADVIAKLSDDGWELGVATGKSSRGLRSTLHLHGLQSRFATLQTADMHPSKPDPAMLEAAIFECAADRAQTVMIGDTTYDIEMARAAQVRAIGVAWGYHSTRELMASGADEVAETPEQLLEMLNG